MSFKEEEDSDSQLDIKDDSWMLPVPMEDDTSESTPQLTNIKTESPDFLPQYVPGEFETVHVKSEPSNDVFLNENLSVGTDTDCEVKTELSIIENETFPYENELSCSICHSRKFYSLEEHLDLEHPEYRPVVKLHNLSKKEITQYQKEIKTKKLVKKTYQVRTVEEKRNLGWDIKCNLCQLTFRNIFLLMDHCSAVRHNFCPTSPTVNKVGTFTLNPLDMYHCDLCVSTQIHFCSLLILVEHKIGHFGISPYHCKICNIYFFSLYSCLQHVDIHHNGNNSMIKTSENTTTYEYPMRCVSCMLECYNFETYVTHLADCQINNGFDLRCLAAIFDLQTPKHQVYLNGAITKYQYIDAARTTLKLKKLAKFRLVKVSNERLPAYFYQCKQCEVPFRKWTDLLQHYFRCHILNAPPMPQQKLTESDFHACRFCHQEFGSRSSLQNHQMQSHLRESIVCVKCNFFASDLAGLQFHQRIRHPGTEMTNKLGDFEPQDKIKQNTEVKEENLAGALTATVLNTRSSSLSRSKKSHQTGSVKTSNVQPDDTSPDDSSSKKSHQTGSAKTSNVQPDDTSPDDSSSEDVTECAIESCVCNPGSPILSCNHCQFHAINPREFLDHLVQNHPSVPVKCPTVSVTTDKMPFRCDHCFARFAQFYDLIHHKIQSKCAYPYHCVFCEYKTSCKPKLAWHFVLEHSNEGVMHENISNHNRCTQYGIQFESKVLHTGFHDTLRNKFKISTEVHQGTIHKVCEVEESTGAKVYYCLTQPPESEGVSSINFIPYQNFELPRLIPLEGELCSMASYQGFVTYHTVFGDWLCLWKCSFCGVDTWSDTELLEHWDMTHFGNQEMRKVVPSSHFCQTKCVRFYCEICTEDQHGFIHLRDLIIHKLLHRNLVFTTCEICLQTFDSNRNLMNHYGVHHYDECVLRYEVTGIRIGGRGCCRNNHQIKTTKDLSNYKMKHYKHYVNPKTGAVYFINSTVLKECRTKKTTAKTTIKFGTSKELVLWSPPASSIYVKILEERYQCSRCKLQCESLSLLSEHAEIAHSDNFVADVIPENQALGSSYCEHCNYMFLHLNSLLCHKLRHRLVYPYFCFLCLQTFYTRTSLTEHHRKGFISAGLALDPR